MEKRAYKISPHFEPRIWGGERMVRRYGYETDVRPVGEVYCVVALPGGADCAVEGTGMTLSELYTAEPSWFDCDTGQLPIRVNILDPESDLSVQLHPDDPYALAHDGSRGKPEAWVVLDCPEDGKIGFGHHARTHEEFAALVDAGDWGNLFKYLPAKKGWFIDIPAGTLHSIGRDVLTYNISRNADLTYRLYDYGRVDPATGGERELHRDKMLDNVVVPDGDPRLVWFEPEREGDLVVTAYWAEPGLYDLWRVACEGSGTWPIDRFCFYTVVEGSGTVNGVPARAGETVLVPAGSVGLVLEGAMDGFVASYTNVRA